ncbi:MAG: hypothetical protein ACKOA3_07475 [Sphingomonadales bacterium]
MKYLPITLLALTLPLLFVTHSNAQESESKFTERAPRQNVYVELGGNGIAFNVMYETRLHKRSDGIGIKAGLGGFSGSYEKVFTLPVGVNWLLTKDNKHFFEAGAGLTFLYYNDTYDPWWPGGTYEVFPVDLAGLSVDKKNSVYGHMTLGYRRQPKNGGITWGAALTPHFNQNGFWPVWVGFKFGYSFARK